MVAMKIKPSKATPPIPLAMAMMVVLLSEWEAVGLLGEDGVVGFVDVGVCIGVGVGGV